MNGYRASAVAAARGRKVLLIEQTSVADGVATSRMMRHWTGESEGPILDELLERAREAEQDYNYSGAKFLKAKTGGGFQINDRGR